MTNKRKTSWETYVHYGYRQFVVANIDFLGQQQRLCELAKHDIEELENNPQIYDLQVETFRAVTNVRDTLDEMLINRSFTSLTENERSLVNEMMPSCVVSQSFSDTMIYHVCLETDQYKPAASIWHILQAIAFIMPISFANELPLRGGIEYHWAGNLSENEIYGPAPYQAYYLESHIAQYPRVVIGEGVMKYLDYLASQQEDDPAIHIARSYAIMALDLITRDTDGIMILNYLGNDCRLSREKEVRYQIANELLPKAYLFINKSLDYFKENNDETLTNRYERLKSYFDISLPLWEEDGFSFH
ncbi:MAG: hypothetical protein ACYDBB_17180 [Armatimonadota bacterium]